MNINMFQGFLENVKQHRWAGLAILEMAQTTRRIWSVLKDDSIEGLGIV